MPPELPDREKLALVMVGLPARGKTHTARKVARFLSWLGYRTRVFNVGNYRRERFGAQVPARFFDPENPEGQRARKSAAMAALDDMCGYLERGGDVAIYDATNSSRERRRQVRERLSLMGLKPLFIESICQDTEAIDANIRATKLRSPDYRGIDPEEAVRDFRARIAFYERAYEPVEDPELSYIKVIDLGRQVVVNRIQGYLPGRIVHFLMNLHTLQRPIWLTRHGQSQDNARGRLGGDSSLTEAGQTYAGRMAARIRELSAPWGGPPVWTSTLRRAIETSQAFPFPSTQWKLLDEIDAGVCDGMTYEEIEQELPEEFAARQADKLRYRYPRGESYQDVIGRLEPVIIELERQRGPVLVIAHQAILRALYAYFMDRPPESCPHLDIPLHTVIELTPMTYGCEERRFTLGPEIGSGPRWPG